MMLKTVFLLIIHSFIFVNTIDNVDIGNPACENYVPGNMCRAIKDMLSRNLGPQGEHCNLPQSPLVTTIFQSYCPKSCCQCQGNIRCQYFDPNFPFQQGPPEQNAGYERM